jgi:hypothetical protein
MNISRGKPGMAVAAARTRTRAADRATQVL